MNQPANDTATPRTDAVTVLRTSPHVLATDRLVFADHARQLERELAQREKRIKELEGAQRELEKSNRGLSSQLANTTLENGSHVKALRILKNEAKALLVRLESYEGHAFYERHQVEIVNLSCAINEVATP